MVSPSSFRLGLIFCVLLFLTIRVTFCVLLCVYMCALPGKAVPKITDTVSGGMLNSTHSLT